MELRKSAKLIFGQKYMFHSEFESNFLSLILKANLCMVFDAAGPAPPVHEETDAQKWLS